MKRNVLITLSCICCVLNNLSCDSYITPQIHYIPEGFIGEIQIYMNQKNGVEKEYLNESRIFRIPKNGVLYTKFEVQTGWVQNRSDIKYYYTDSSDLITKQLKNCTWCTADSVETNDIGVLGSAYYSGYINGSESSRLIYSVDSLWKNFN